MVVFCARNTAVLQLTLATNLFLSWPKVLNLVTVQASLKHLFKKFLILMDNKDFRPPSPPDANIALVVLKDDLEMVRQSGSVYYSLCK